MIWTIQSFKIAPRFFSRLHRGDRRICPRERRKKRVGERARGALQFISVGLISVASRGLRLTFRWSFVRRSTEVGAKGREQGENGEKERQGGWEGGPAFLRQHTGRPCRRGRRSRRRSVEEENGRVTRTFRPIKLQCPSKVPRRRQGSLDLPLLASPLQHVRLRDLRNNLLSYSAVWIAPFELDPLLWFLDRLLLERAVIS